MNANATSLVRRYVAARAEVATLIDVDASSRSVDRAIAEEAVAEHALRQHVKMATGQTLSRPLRYPVAASMEGVLVVVAPDPSDEWDEIVVILDRRDIARGE